MEYEKIKDKIAFKMINPKRNNYCIDDLATTDFLDLKIMYFVIISHDETGYGMLLIRKIFLDQWHISVQELHRQAVKNVNSLFTPQLYGNTDMTVKCLMVTTMDMVYGAIYMLNNTLLKYVSELFDDDVCIIPSSVHEILLMPAERIVPEEMNMTIRHINSVAVSKDEYLSDHMYLYSRKTDTVLY